MVEPLWHLAIESTYIGRFSSFEILFDARGALLNTISWRRSGGSSYRNDRRYTTEHIERVRRAPDGKAEVDQAPETWSRATRSTESYPKGWKQCKTLTDPATVLHFLSTGKGIPADLCFLSDKAIFHIETIENPDPVTLSLKVLDLRPSSGNEKTIAKPEAVTFQARKIELRPHPLDEEDAAKSFELLGLESDLVVYVGVHDNLPLKLSGKARFLGRLNIHLTEIR